MVERMMKNLKLFFTILPSLSKIKQFLVASDLLGVVEGEEQELTQMGETIHQIEKLLDKKGDIH